MRVGLYVSLDLGLVSAITVVYCVGLISLTKPGALPSVLKRFDYINVIIKTTSL